MVVQLHCGNPRCAGYLPCAFPAVAVICCAAAALGIYPAQLATRGSRLATLSQETQKPEIAPKAIYAKNPSTNSLNQLPSLPKTIPPGINRKSFILLDRINFWEPFQREKPETQVTPTHIVKDMIKLFLQTKGVIKNEAFKHPQINTEVVISASTLNQFHALKPIIDKLGNRATLISENPDIHPNQPSVDYYKRLSLRYAMKRFMWYFTLPAYQREMYRSRYYNYYKILGQYRHWLKAFKKSKAKYYIAANDHSGLSQVGFVAARDAGLKTIYIQHAAVSNLFPPLMVDYALLDGQDARQKYAGAGPSKAEVHLIGTMKYDSYLLDHRLNKPGKRIGVCISSVAHNIEKNIALCHALHASGQAFCLRFHPAVNAGTRRAFTANGWETSEPETESALDFIFRCHTIISGDSTILLEASVLKRRPLYFPSDGIALDYYGFLKAGILDTPCYTVEEVLAALQKPFNIEAHRQNARHFCHTLYTPDEGHSTDRAIKILETILG